MEVSLGNQQLWKGRCLCHLCQNKTPQTLVLTVSAGFVTSLQAQRPLSQVSANFVLEDSLRGLAKGPCLGMQVFFS